MSIQDSVSFENEMLKLIRDEKLREKMGRQNTLYVERKKGATVTIMNYLKKLLAVS